MRAELPTWLLPFYQKHILAGALLYILFALTDSILTIHGMAGDYSLEANPLIRSMMYQIGPVLALFLVKGTVFGLGLFISIGSAYGIEYSRPWIYWLTITPATRRWMKRRKRRFVALLPLYCIAASQAFASVAWLWLLISTNRL